jgi:hypothetical protein
MGTGASVRNIYVPIVCVTPLTHPRQFIRKLRNQHVHYAQTIRLLFEPITSEQELAEMMSNPGSSDLWKGHIMTRKLQQRLQESFDAYQDTIVDIERITKKIASKLDLDRATEVRDIAGMFTPCIPLTYYSYLGTI